MHARRRPTNDGPLSPALRYGRHRKAAADRVPAVTFAEVVTDAEGARVLLECGARDAQALVFDVDGWRGLRFEMDAARGFLSRSHRGERLIRRTFLPGVTALALPGLATPELASAKSPRTDGAPADGRAADPRRPRPRAELRARRRER